MFYWFVLVLQCDAFIIIILSAESRQNQGRGLVDRKLVKDPPPCFGYLVILDVVCRNLSLFLLYINIKIGKNRC